MKWISTDGGPLVVAPIGQAPKWTGVDGDYELACEIEDYTGIVEEHGAEFLILNDEPLQSTVVEVNGTPSIVRWQYAPDERSLLQAIQEFSFQSSSPVEEIQFHPTDEMLLLFDSAEPKPRDDHGLGFTVESGVLVVTTCLCTPSTDISAIVHQFRPYC